MNFAQRHTPALWCSCCTARKVNHRRQVIPHTSPRASAIVRQILFERDVLAEDLFKPERGPSKVSDCRIEIAARLRDEMEWSTIEIGKFLGRDHSSVSHMLRQAREGRLS